MANRLQLRRGSTAPGSIFYEGEPIFDLSNMALYVGDTGATGTGVGTSIASSETFLASLQILTRATESTAGAVNLYEDTDNGTNKVQLIAPASLSGDITLTLPSDDGDNGQLLKTDGSGNLSFETPFSIGADTGTVDPILVGDTITFTGGEGIDTSVTDGVITVSAEDATSSNKGVASFDTGDFVLTSGAVALGATFVHSVTTDSGELTPSDHTYSILGGEGMDVTHAGTTITVAGENASDSNKGVASFSDTTDFGVSSGDVSLADTVVKTVTTDSGALTPSSHGFSVLGGEGMDVTHSGTTVTVAGEDASDSNKGVASFDSGDFSVSSGNVTLADSSDGAVLAISGTANEVNVSRSNGTVTVGLP